MTIHQRLFNETVKGRKVRQPEEISVAADRGLIKMLGNGNSIGYNSKWKVINDKISLQIMNKYKTGYSSKVSVDLKSFKSDKSFINKDTISMGRRMTLAGSSNLLPSTLASVRISENIMDRGYSPIRRSTKSDLDTVSEEGAPESFRYRDVDKFITSYKKTKQSKIIGSDELLSSINDKFKKFDIKRKQNMINQRRSLPNLHFNQNEYPETSPTKSCFTFRMRDSEEGTHRNLSMQNNLHILSSSKIKEVVFLPRVMIDRLQNDREPQHVSSNISSPSKLSPDVVTSVSQSQLGTTDEDFAS